MITIYASDNKFSVNDDGDILNAERESAYVKFDIAEFKKYYGYVNRHIDILDVGCWTKNGMYVPADQDFRFSVKSGFN